MISAFYRAQSISNFLYSRCHPLLTFGGRMVMVPLLYCSERHTVPAPRSRLHNEAQRTCTCPERIPRAKQCQCFITLLHKRGAIDSLVREYPHRRHHRHATHHSHTTARTTHLAAPPQPGPLPAQQRSRTAVHLVLPTGGVPPAQTRQYLSAVSPLYFLLQILL